MTAQALQIVEPREIQHQLTVQEVKAQVVLIQEVMRAVMQEGHHYGVIPGTEKPSLLKPGAEKLSVTFRLAPKLVVEMRDLGNGHREYQVTCTLYHIPTGQSYGEGVGSCSTLEGRYRWRTAARVCPSCGKEAIIKGKEEYGGGWLCFGKKGGCGAKFDEEDSAITAQPTGKIENADIADVYNTVLKMAKKRALVDATLTATAASDIFTQDVEDFGPEPVVERAAAPTQQQRETPQAANRSPQTATPPDPPVREIAAPQVISVGQRKRLFALCKEHDVSHDTLKLWLAHKYELDSTSHIPTDKYDEICTAIQNGTLTEAQAELDEQEPGSEG